MKTIVEVENLSYRYPSKPLFENFSFQMKQGDWVVFIGNNGAGKSTLLKCIAGVIPLQSGSVKIDSSVRKAYVGQHEFTLHNQFPATAYEIVLSAYTKELGFFKHPNATQKKAATQALIDLGLEKEIDTRLAQLSGGQKQRVFIAKALLMKPDLLFLDEPTSALDAVFTFDLLKKLKAYQEKGLSIMMVSHDLALAQMVTQQILCVAENGVLGLDKDSIEEELAHRHQHIGVHHV